MQLARLLWHNKNSGNIMIPSEPEYTGLASTVFRVSPMVKQLSLFVRKYLFIRKQI